MRNLPNFPRHTNQEILSAVRSLQKPNLCITSIDGKEMKMTMQLIHEHGFAERAVYSPNSPKGTNATAYNDGTELPLDEKSSGLQTKTTTKWHRSAIKQRHPESRKYDQKNAVHFFYPPRLINKLGISYGVQITSRSTAGWQYSLNIFRTVPENSPIFEFCRDGNLSAVRTLLTTRNASPWDRDPMGRTPLWVYPR